MASRPSVETRVENGQLEEPYQSSWGIQGVASLP
jgi:hypothetical protein